MQFLEFLKEKSYVPQEVEKLADDDKLTNPDGKAFFEVQDDGYGTEILGAVSVEGARKILVDHFKLLKENKAQEPEEGQILS
jgi:hypothetical protein